MKYHYIILALALSFCSLNTTGQTESADFSYGAYIGSGADTLLFSAKPVTNREYIIYLVWMYNTYGTDYPETFENVFPGLSQNEMDASMYKYGFSPEKLFDTIFKYSQPFVKNYMFNPKYIDYPVIGITWLQASHFCKWLSDRYNEFKLIKNGYYKFDLDQSNEDCFTTESYLSGQFYGVRIKNKENINLKWKDRMLTPAFRLPTEKENADAKKQIAMQSDLKEYAFVSDDILKLWNDWYLKVTSEKLVVNYSNFTQTAEIVSPGDNWEKETHVYEELFLDAGHTNENLSVEQVFEKHNQKSVNIKDLNEQEKDSLGQMPYIIINETQKKEPVAVAKFNKSDNSVLDASKLYFFRFVCAMKPKQYK